MDIDSQIIKSRYVGLLKNFSSYDNNEDLMKEIINVIKFKRSDYFIVIDDWYKSDNSCKIDYKIKSSIDNLNYLETEDYDKPIYDVDYENPCYRKRVSYDYILNHSEREKFDFDNSKFLRLKNNGKYILLVSNIEDKYVVKFQIDPELFRSYDFLKFLHNFFVIILTEKNTFECEKFVNKYL